LNGSRSGVEIEGLAENIIIDSMYITDWHDLAGVFTNGNGWGLTDGIKNVTIRNCSIISFVNGGAQVDGMSIKGSTNMIIHDNFIHIRTQNPTNHVDGIQAFISKGFKVYNNVMINDALFGETGGGGATLILRPDVIANPPIDEPILIYNNFLYTGGTWSPNSNWHGNLFTRLNAGENPNPNCLVAHNTIVSNGVMYSPIILEWPCEFSNNIITQFGSGCKEMLL